MRMSSTSTYKEMMINSKMLEVPRGSYQRELNINRVRKIAAKFAPVWSPRRSATATVTTMCSTDSTLSQSSSCSMAAKT